MPETLAQVFSREFCEVSKSTFSYRTPLVAVFKAQVFSEFFRILLDVGLDQLDEIK